VPTKLVPSLKDEVTAKEEVLLTLWADSFEIFYQRLSNELLRSDYDAIVIGNIIYEYFHLVTRWKFETSRHGFKYQKQFWGSSSLDDSMNRLYKLKPPTTNPSKIYSTILDRIKSISLETRANGVVTLPSVKLDMMARFIRWTDKAPLQEKDRTELLTKAIASFGSILRDSFNKPYKTYKSKPLFGAHKHLNQFNWGKVCVVLRDNNSIDKLLFKLDLVIPDRTSNSGKNNDLIRYDDTVRFQTERVRTYFFLISKIYREVISAHKDITLIKQIEAFYADLINQFTIDKFAVNQINVLHTDFEYSYGFDRLRLLPEIVYDLNCFIDPDIRSKTIKVLGDRLAFNQLVEVWYFLSSEGDKKTLLDQIGAIGLERLLKESKWLPDIELTLRILGWSNLFQSEMAKMIEKLQASNGKKFRAIIFQLKLYKFYHSNDLESIKNLIVPEANGPEVSAKDFLAEKSLMEALVLHRLKKYDNAIEILKRLNQSNRKLVYSLNIFACLIGKGEDEKSSDARDSLINDALDYWENEKTALNIDDSDELGVVAWYNQLNAFDILKRFDDFEALFRKIPTAYKMTSLLLQARVTNLIHQGRDVEADQLLLVASEYHRQHDGSLPEFLVELNSQATSPAQITRLQNSYLQILGKSPADLIKIIPDKINHSKDTLTAFLTNEIEYCLLELIKRVRSITEVKKETKYNDLFTSILQARISLLDWVAKDNSNANKSSKGPNPGERDIVIQSNRSEIAVIECLHFNGRSKKYIWDHLTKVLDYSSLTIPRFIVCYYKGSQTNFNNSWNKYKKEMFPRTPFKSDFKPKPNSIKNLKANSPNVLIGKSAHKNYELVHLFINLKI
jgi:tetratricopeptide (TPR) repeat protein